MDVAERPTAERVEYWRSSVCDHFVPLAVQPGGSVLRGRVAGTMLAETRLRRIRATQHVFERRTRDIRVDDPGVMHLLFQDRGQAVMEQDGRTASLSPGDLLFYDSSRPFRFRTSDEFQFTICLLPKRLISLPERIQQNRTARVVSSRDGIGAAAGALLSSITRQVADAGPAQQLALQQAFASMYVALMSDDASEGRSPSVHLAQAQSFILRHLGDTGLAPADIAAACNISVSYLHRLFAADGSTIAGYLRESRLQAAYRELSAPGSSEPVSLIGQRWGIPDPTHFSRLFKTRFGITPGQARRGTAEGIATALP